MAYIDVEYFKKEFSGCDIPLSEFSRLSAVASDVIDSLTYIEIDKNAAYMDSVKKAVGYEVEMLYMQGGIDAITGLANGMTVSSESLGGYSVSMNSTNSGLLAKTKDGIPISALSLSILRKAGLLCRWAYYERYKKYGKV